MKCYEFAAGKVGCEKEKPKNPSRQSGINLILMLLENSASFQHHHY